MRLATIQNEEIIIKDYSTSLITKTGETIMNAHLLSDEELFNIGYYRVTNQSVELKPWQIKTGETKTIVENKCIIKSLVKDIKIVDFKDQKMKQFKSECSEEILEEYPTYKQINIIRQAPNYTQEDLDNMNEFIDSRRELINTLEEITGTYEEIDKLYYRQGIYAEGDDDMIKPIDYKYWGE